MRRKRRGITEFLDISRKSSGIVIFRRSASRATSDEITSTKMSELLAEVQEKTENLKLSASEEEEAKLKSDKVEKANDEENDEDGDDDDDENDNADPNNTSEKKKKKKKKKKKSAKKKAGDGEVKGSVELPPPSAEVLPHSRLLGGRTDYYLKYGQTFPPTRPVSELFPQGNFPVGEIQPHGKTKYPDPSSSWARKSEEEKR